MAIQAQRWHRLSACLTLTVSLLAGNCWQEPVTAQAFNPPPGQGSPKGTAGGSRPIRSDCTAGSTRQEGFLALSAQRFMSLTTHARPTFWVYVPRTSAKTLEFSVFDDQQTGLYQVTLPLDGQSGLVKLTLPAEVASLTEGKVYGWTAALVCNPQRRTDDWLVQGWVRHQRLPDAIARQLQSATPEERIQLYAEAGFWYDTLDALIELRRSQPSNSKWADRWSELLQIGGLPIIAEPPQMVQANPR